jgi:hypothetical protein
MIHGELNHKSMSIWFLINSYVNYPWAMNEFYIQMIYTHDQLSKLIKQLISGQGI